MQVEGGRWVLLRFQISELKTACPDFRIVRNENRITRMNTIKLGLPLFYKALRKRTKAFYLFLILLGLTNSMLTSFLFICVSSILSHTKIPFVENSSWQLFCGILVLSLLCRKFFHTHMAVITREIVLEFEVSIFTNLRNANFEKFEKMEPEKVYTAASDAGTLSGVPGTLINALNSIAIILSCLVYIFWNSLIGGFLITAVMTMLACVYLHRNKALEKDINEKRRLIDEYYRYLNDVLWGYKEIKISENRTSTVYNQYLIHNRLNSKELDTRIAIAGLNNELLGSYSWYIVLGVIIFVLPLVTTTLLPSEITAFSITVLYLISPVSTIIGMISYYQSLKVSLARLIEFENHLKSGNDTSVHDLEFPYAKEKFQSVRFENVTYQYMDKDKKTFSLGPLNIEIKKGEILFVTGGNGSGKSTFIKVLCGLYQAHRGKVYFNEKPVSQEEYLCFRDRISSIFTNNYLFCENYNGYDLSPSNQELHGYKELMHMSDILKLDPQRNIFHNQLSKGQQKRLALIYALLEKNDILVLDEWAAEQDPKFRTYFYDTILTELKQMGKTLIVVTHDDEFYSFADRIIKFNYGRIVQDQMISTEKERLS